MNDNVIRRGDKSALTVDESATNKGNSWNILSMLVKCGKFPVLFSGLRLNYMEEYLLFYCEKTIGNHKIRINKW